MDPYVKGFKISGILHGGVVAVLFIGILFGEIFKPRPSAVFTVMAPPSGMIAGGPAATPDISPSQLSPFPQGPKLPSPTPSAEIQKKAAPANDFFKKIDAAPTPVSTPASETVSRKIETQKTEDKKNEKIDKTEIAKAIPSDDFLTASPPKPKAVKRKSDNGTIKPTPPAPKPNEKLSYAEFQKKYAPKETTASKNAKNAAAAAKAAKLANATAKTKNLATAKSPMKPNAYSSQAIPSATPSFEENLASRLDRRLQEEGETTAGTGLGGAPGSGVMSSNGTPGAIDDVEALYSGAIYTYLNSVWEEPKEVGSVHLFAKAEFNVNREGTITSWRITRGSGSESFDRSVARVFGKIKQVTQPPTPQEYRLSVVFETRDS